MQILRQEVAGDRRVSLIEYDGWFAVRIEARGPVEWEDISLRADRDLAFEVASRRERQRLAEQQARAIEWAQDERRDRGCPVRRRTRCIHGFLAWRRVRASGIVGGLLRRASPLRAVSDVRIAAPPAETRSACVFGRWYNFVSYHAYQRFLVMR